MARALSGSPLLGMLEGKTLKCSHCWSCFPYLRPFHVCVLCFLESDSKSLEGSSHNGKRKMI